MTVLYGDVHRPTFYFSTGLDADMQRRARKTKRKTELRVQARSKLKKTKALSKIKAFSNITEPEMEAMIDVMVREFRLMGDVLCQQGQVADKFYVVMSGECGAFVNDKNGYRQVGTIPMYGFFGESSLLSKPGVDDIRNATVEVMSDSSALLILSKTKFYQLIEKGVLNRKILDGVKIVDKKRQEQNLDESSRLDLETGAVKKEEE